jgi:hypothetical protein
MVYVIEVRLIGENIKPEQLSSRDIGQLIASVEEMIAPLVARDNPALGIDESEVTVGLSSVQQGSYILRFETLYESASQVAYNKVTNAIDTGKYDTLPHRSIEAIKTVRKISRKYQTDTQFWEKNGTYKQLATVSAATEIDVEVNYVSGKTTIYGSVIGIIGYNPPRVTLRLLDGSIIRCNVTTQNNLIVAKQLGQHLYSDVGVRGTARWNVRDMSIQYFHVEELTAYRKVPLIQALDALNDIAGADYQSIEDINALIGEIRGSDEDF